MTDPIRFPDAASVPFPYSPYPQQVDLMNTIFEALSSHSKVWMIESPTGTGKSLSVATAVLTALRTLEEHDFTVQHESSNNTISSGIDWIDDWESPEELQEQERFAQARTTARHARDSLRESLSQLRLQLSKTHNRESVVRRAVAEARTVQPVIHKRKRPNSDVQDQDQDPLGDGDFLLLDYRSGDEGGNDDSEKVTSTNKENRSKAGMLLSGPLLDGSSTINRSSLSSAIPYTIGGVVPGSGVRKIIYAARTHSQLRYV